MKTLALAFRFARRDLRGGVKGLRIVLACLALGVAAITAVGTLRAGIEAGIATDGAKLLGGEVEVASQQGPLPQAALDWLTQHSARLSRVTSMRAMAVAPDGDRTLVELKAVDDFYPLFGELVLDPPGQIGSGEIAVDRLIADRLGVAAGTELRIGEARFALRGFVAAEPDKVTNVSILGPRAMIRMADLDATQLVQPGSLVTFEYRVALPPGASRSAFVDAFREAFPRNGWRIRTADAAAPSVNRFVDRAAFFLTLASLTALLVGGIGVATGVRSWLDQRARTIATLRCLGASPGVIFATYLVQVIALAAAGIAIGLVAGFGLTFAAASALADALPVPPRLGLYPAVLALAALYGMLTALAFALWPLGRAMEIPGAALFRDTLQPAGVRPRLTLVLGTMAAGLALAALIVGTAENRMFAVWFVMGAAGTLVVFRLGAFALMAAARRLRFVRRPAVRLGLANLHRPGAPTPLILVSLGIGLTTLAAIALIEGNMRRQITEQIPDAAPSFYFIDIQSNQARDFDRVAAEQPTVSEVKRVPSLRARIVAVNGVPAEEVRTTPETAWALRGDRGLTYAATPPEGTRIVAGQWWPADYRGEPLVSFDANLARGWGIGLGDTITVSVLGRDIPLRIANLRDIAWRGLGLNFVLVASPGLLEAAPHTHIATVRAAPAEEGAVLRAISEAFPNVSGVRVRDAIEQVAALLARIGTALTATASMTLSAGALVLAGAVAAGQRRRVRDAVVLKTVGATRAQIRSAFLVEFGLLGATAGLIAAVAGTLAAWGVVRFVMGGEWVFLPGTLAAVVLACTALTLVFGHVGTALALRARPAPLLRNE
ncbi:FtsX-like permease family protein [Roseomonas sp. HJA6]|uniref:FtsX-like permease family protein n=1 Tax=Roseomonas alba TaxID=2846776 RepID=A0ABS7AH01_9PROT|nr:FtsX-like permease family protein [Neoroseomonas alba]MBW6400610.1 FtsX-like permease family protein [Neoroseomonas alba]